MKKETIIKITATALLVLIALMSLSVGTNYATNPETYAETIRSLDEKKSTVMALTASSAIASTAIAAIPGDASTPVASKIADLSSSLLLILCAIYLEKALVTLTGYASCRFLIPAAMALFGICIWKKNPHLKDLAVKLLVFALVIMLVIPVGVEIGDMVYATYDSSIQDTISMLNDSAENVEEEKLTEEKNEEVKKDETKSDAKGETKDEGGLKGWLSGVKDKAEDVAGNVKDKADEVVQGIGNAVSNVGESVGDVMTKTKLLLNNFIDSIAMLIITSCLIPVAIIMFFLWLTKAIFAVNINATGTVKKLTDAKKKIAGSTVKAGASAGKKLLKKE